MSEYRVYRHYSMNGELLYVGASQNLDARTKRHLLTAKWRDEIHRVESVSCNSEIEMLTLEIDTIRSLRPKHNVRGMLLPTDSELEEMHYVYTPNRFYDSVKRFFKFESDNDICRLFSIPLSHVKMARLRMKGPGCFERRYLADLLFCLPCQVEEEMYWRRRGPNICWRIS